jgi:diguanylate cyclase (GGDEF)-like protein
MLEDLLNKLYQNRNYSEFSANNGFLLVKKILKLWNINDQQESAKITKMLNHFANIFISEKTFEPALDLYNHKISHFQKNYDHQNLLKSFQQADQLFDLISVAQANSTSNLEPDHQYFQDNFLQFLETSYDFITNRTSKLIVLDNKTCKTEMAILNQEIQLQAKHISDYLNCMYQNFETCYNKTKKQSLTDDLTKLHNRRYLFKHYVRYFFLAKRFKVTFSVLLMDLDKFKRINDTYGHHKGDEVLKKVAEVLHNSFRESDIKVRIGGDEFIILLFDSNQQHATRLSKDILDKINALEFISDSGEIFHVGASIGVSINPTRAIDNEEDFKIRFEKIIKEADAAMYYSKNNVNKVTVYSEEISKLK